MKRIVVGLVLVWCCPVFAQGGSDLVGTMVEKRRELIALQLENKIKEEKNKTAASVPGGAAAPTIEPGSMHLPVADPDGTGDFKLVGIYGVGDELEAEIGYKGAVIPLRRGMELGGWSLYSVESHAVTLRKLFSGRPAGKAEVVTVDQEVTGPRGEGRRVRAVTMYAKTLRLYMSPVREMAAERNTATMPQNMMTGMPGAFPGSPMAPPPAPPAPSATN